MKQLKKRYSALTQREKWLSLGAAVVVCFILGLQLAINPREEELGKALRLQQDLKTAINEQRQTLANVLQAIATHPAKQLQGEIQVLQVQSRRLDEQLAVYTQQMLVPSEMRQTLSQLLTPYRAIEVLAMRSLPSVDVTQGEKLEGQGRIYKHSVELKVKGRFFDLLGFVEQVEKQQPLFWQALNYQVLDYPYAETTLVLHTLSIDAAFVAI